MTLKILAVSSGKGGVGKSCITACTGAALARQGKKTLLIEMGADARSLDLITGTQDRTVFTITDVAGGICDAEKALVQTVVHDNLYLMPAAWNAADPVDGQVFRRVMDSINTDFDAVILDGVDFSVFPADIPDCILCVATPDSMSVRSCTSMTAHLYASGAREIRLIINRVPPKIAPIRNVTDFDDIIDQTGAQLIAVLPESPKFHHAANSGLPLSDDSIVPSIFDSLAARLFGEYRPLLIK